MRCIFSLLQTWLLVAIYTYAYKISYPAAYEEACSCLFFDPNEHPENMLKAFQEFIQCFQLQYDTLYPDTPKVSLESAIEWWKITTATQENPSPKPSLEQFDEICKQTKSCDKVSRNVFIQ